MPICSVGAWPRPFPYRTALKSPRFVFYSFTFTIIFTSALYSEFHSQQLGSVMLTSDYTFLPLEGEVYRQD